MASCCSCSSDMPRSTVEAGGDVFVLVVVVTTVREEQTMMARDLAARASGVTEHMNCSNAIDKPWPTKLKTSAIINTITNLDISSLY